MKTKLEMAHEYAMLHMMNPQYKDVDDLEMVKWAWDYADAMQAEADKRKPSGLPEALKEEWQPDWSQAPDDAVAWVYSKLDKSGFWCHKTPVKLSKGWCTSTMLKKAPTFNYQGSWQDSLRERPNGF